MGDTHVVFGAGAVGRSLLKELSEHGLPTRVICRSTPEALPAGIEVLSGDAADPQFAARAISDAAVVYQCLNPPYHRWPHDFPLLQDAAVAGAQSAGARYVSFENLYMYGDTHGAPMDEDTPHAPCTRKGRVRAAMAEQLAELSLAGDLEVVTARASDYFGPGGSAQSPLGDMVVGRALRGKSAQVQGDPSMPHTYTYLPDIGRALAALGIRDDVIGEVFHVPSAPPLTTREIIAEVGRQLDAEISVQPTPRLLLRAIGLFNPTVRELDEMRYEFTGAFVMDSSKARQRLGIDATPMPDAIAATIEWFSAAPMTPPAESSVTLVRRRDQV